MQRKWVVRGKHLELITEGKSMINPGPSEQPTFKLLQPATDSHIARDICPKTKADCSMIQLPTSRTRTLLIAGAQESGSREDLATQSWTIFFEAENVDAFDSDVDMRSHFTEPVFIDWAKSHNLKIQLR
ncbi:hypothetical protein Tco_1294902 [Tanacetum coccineum]